MADVVFSRGIALMVFIAFLADNQQWSMSIRPQYPPSSLVRNTATNPVSFPQEYQEAKKSYQNTAKVPSGFHREDLDRGFNTISMWSYSRHPNFAAEQSVWVLLYLWGAFVTKGWINWTIIGPIAYLGLFQASTWFTELISARKYPEYKEYQKRVGMFLPLPSTGPPGDFSDKRKKSGGD